MFINSTLHVGVFSLSTLCEMEVLTSFVDIKILFRMHDVCKIESRTAEEYQCINPRMYCYRTVNILLLSNSKENRISPSRALLGG